MQAIAQNSGGNALGGSDEFLEARLPEDEVAHDQQGPAIPEKIEGASHGQSERRGLCPEEGVRWLSRRASREESSARLILSRRASTAAVKPDPKANANALREFDLSCDLVERAVKKIDNLRTAARLAHPWFGPLDAGQWHFVAGFHAGLHRQQIELILRQMEAKAAGGGSPS